MSKIAAGVFLGVFVSALFYEVFSRQNPELAEKIRKKFNEKCNKSLEPVEVMEN